jgi:hypothetical protein
MSYPLVLELAADGIAVTPILWCHRMAHVDERQRGLIADERVFVIGQFVAEGNGAGVEGVEEPPTSLSTVRSG